MEPIKLHLTAGGPNPWKVYIVLEELKLPFDVIAIPYPDLKKPPYLTINPNGRAPAIEDPNTKLILWESCAIIEYLIEQYDKDKVLTYDGFQEKQHLRQWMYFQASGQGPYFGQAAWFTMFHHEKLPSAQTRYYDEVKRVTGVLDTALGWNGTGWLVGNKCTYADLAFCMWNRTAHEFMGADYDIAAYPHFKSWQDRMLARPSVQKTVAVRQGMVAPH